MVQFNLVRYDLPVQRDKSLWIWLSWCRTGHLILCADWRRGIVLCLCGVRLRPVAWQAGPSCRETVEWSMTLWFPIQKLQVSKPIRALATVQVWFTGHLYVLINQQSVICVIMSDMQPHVGLTAWRTRQVCKYVTQNIALYDYMAAMQ